MPPTACCLCFVRRPIREKVLPQPGHWYRLTAECVCMCALRLDRSAKARWHTRQEKGRSPVCVRMCSIRLNRELKERPQPEYVQQNFFARNPVGTEDRRRACGIRFD